MSILEQYAWFEFLVGEMKDQILDYLQQLDFSILAAEGIADPIQEQFVHVFGSQMLLHLFVKDGNLGIHKILLPNDALLHMVTELYTANPREFCRNWDEEKLRFPDAMCILKGNTFCFGWEQG